jgi:NAD(P)H-hydrate epimerase
MFVTPEQMQQLEALTDAAGISYAEMMRRAGTALADYIQSCGRGDRKAVFLAGKGNNGGDCYVAAACLREKGWQVQVIAPFGEPKTEISRTAMAHSVRCGVSIVLQPDAFTENAGILVDGLFGTGFHGVLPSGSFAYLKGHSGQFRIACDIPSGGNGLTGQVSSGTFQADATVTFGAEKLGMSQYPLRSFCGEIHVADIGIPETAFAALSIPPVEELTLAAVRQSLPPRKPDAHKNSSGHLAIVAGSVRMRGAAVLAAAGAVRSGVGLVTCASAEAALQIICQRTPEVMCLPLKTDEAGFFICVENQSLLADALRGKQALLLGCGMGVTEETQELTKFLLSASHCPLILDADGLNCVSDCIECIPGGRTVLTPHPGEAARLLGITAAQVQTNRPAAATELARRTGAVVVLKGAGTIVTDGERMAVCRLGNAGMARAGSGDVLSGITASLVAQGLELYEAACTAVTLHAAAGDAAARRLPERYMLPQDLIQALQEVL